MRKEFFLGTVAATLSAVITVYLLQEVTDKSTDSDEVEKKIDNEKFRKIYKSSPSQRSKKILALLKEKKSVRIGEIHSFFPEVSRRTLRRDFDRLEMAESIRQIGLTKDSQYVLNM